MQSWNWALLALSKLFILGSGNLHIIGFCCLVSKHLFPGSPRVPGAASRVPGCFLLWLARNEVTRKPVKMWKPEIIAGTGGGYDRWSITARTGMNFLILAVTALSQSLVQGILWYRATSLTKESVSRTWKAKVADRMRLQCIIFLVSVSSCRALSIAVSTSGIVDSTCSSSLMNPCYSDGSVIFSLKNFLSEEVCQICHIFR